MATTVPTRPGAPPSTHANHWPSPELDGTVPAAFTAEHDGRLSRGVCAALILGTSAALWWSAIQLVRWLLP